jgi:hypothetical protein
MKGHKIVDFSRLTSMCDLDLGGSNQIIALQTSCHYDDHWCKVILKTSVVSKLRSHQKDVPKLRSHKNRRFKIGPLTVTLT